MRLTSSTRSSVLPVPQAEAWAVLAAGGPGPHWYLDAAPFLLRGALDRLVGGSAPAPPTKHAMLRPGDTTGLWLVRRAGRFTLDLEARVRAPGTVLLSSVLHPSGGGSRLVQTVHFEPRGLLGIGYLVVDLPAREALIGLVHRRVREELAD